MRKYFKAMVIVGVLSAVVGVGAQYWAQPMPVEVALSTVVPYPVTAGLTCYSVVGNIKVLTVTTRPDVLFSFERIEVGGGKSLCFVRANAVSDGRWPVLSAATTTLPAPEAPVLYGNAYTNK